jgi:hypothetical protein
MTPQTSFKETNIILVILPIFMLYGYVHDKTEIINVKELVLKSIDEKGGTYDRVFRPLSVFLHANPQLCS